MSRTFTKAEVDALIAAAVALVVQKAAEHYIDLVNFAWTCHCGLFLAHWGERDSGHKAWQDHIRSLANPNALKEHDAALREALKLQTEVFREQKSKLEAENAGLRESLRECHRAAEPEGCK